MRIPVVLAVLLLLVAIGISGCATTSTPATGWEYKLMGRAHIESYGAPANPTKGKQQRIKACFRHLGTEGWEYVGELGVGEGEYQRTLYVFKRPGRNR